MTERPTSGLLDALGSVGILPVVTLDEADRAPALVAALHRGGATAVEITLRTPAALDAIRRVVEEVPGAPVGAGTVTSIDALHAAVEAGAAFGVSPGFDPAVVDAARERGVPFLPGVATPTEVMQAVTHGVEVVKLFPAEVLGGPRLIAALSAVWPEVQFVPTGGISTAELPAYLALSQVVAVGGSWMVPRAAVTVGDWDAITEAMAAAIASAAAAGMGGRT